VPRVIPTKLEGLVLVEPDVHGDERGFFVETFRIDAWRDLGIDQDFVQHNHSRSRRGVLRGMHFQTVPGQGKLIRCARGRIFDVAVDMRAGSPTLGQWEGFELDDERHRQLFVPIGFGHGFCVLSEVADVNYLVTSTFDPRTESGFAWNDDQVGIEWPIEDPQVSSRDADAPSFREVVEKAVA